ncbi:MAG: GNAT family N-acetyltransferase [Oscillospiraceae bacterium]|nr:GNAT family N-acetyltransferase [Oscillospiraceae bacterium]
MIKIIHSFSGIDFEGLATVYDLNDKDGYTDYWEFFDYLRDVFFTAPGAFYAVREDEKGYASVLRAEPYSDGYLIEALQTRSDIRNKGFAKELLGSVVRGAVIPEGLPIYSHIRKNNTESLAVHRSCGFKEYLEYAKYIDGSVYTNSCTMIYRR